MLSRAILTISAISLCRPCSAQTSAGVPEHPVLPDGTFSRRLSGARMSSSRRADKQQLDDSGGSFSTQAMLNCSAIVADPVDAHPVRSPQVRMPRVHHATMQARYHATMQCRPKVALLLNFDTANGRLPQVVHSAITRHLRGRSLVEIGTRNGDGMACFARAARSAVAVEMDTTYCKKLRQRAHAIGDGRAAFSVACSKFEEAALDADVFTWWQQLPALRNAAVLRHLRRQQDARRIRSEAIAIVLFEKGFGEDMQSYEEVQSLASFTWSESVPFNESALCRKRYRRHYKWWRGRTSGSFIVAGIRIADVRL